MIVEIKGKAVVVTNNSKVKLKDNRIVTVTGDFRSHVVGRDELNNLVVVNPSDIIEVLKVVVEVLPLIDRIIKIIKSWFGK